MGSEKRLDAERSSSEWAEHFERLFYAGAVGCPAELRALGLAIVRDASFYGEVSGESHYRAAFDALMRGASVRDGSQQTVVLVALVREPTNPHDEHAVGVHAVFESRSGLRRKPRNRNVMIGHIPAAKAPAVSASLAEHEAYHPGEHIFTAAWLRRRYDGENGRTYDWAKLSDITDLYRCQGIKKDGERCQNSAADRKLTCTVHDPERKATKAGKPRAPKVAVNKHELRAVEDLRKGDMWICHADHGDRTATPQMVTGIKTVTEKYLMCSDTTRHASWCDDHAECEETETSVIVSTVGVRGGEYSNYCSPGELVVLGIAE